MWGITGTSMVGHYRRLRGKLFRRLAVIQHHYLILAIGLLIIACLDWRAIKEKF
jgi:hypothetical protein